MNDIFQGRVYTNSQVHCRSTAGPLQVHCRSTAGPLQVKVNNQYNNLSEDGDRFNGSQFQIADCLQEHEIYAMLLQHYCDTFLTCQR